MSENELVRDMPALREALTLEAGTIAAGTGSETPAATLAEDDALDAAPDVPQEVLMLRTQQQYALEDLMAGRTHADAARTAGVDRRTLFRWINHDPAFRAAMDAWRQRTLKTADDRLTQAIDQAAITLSLAAARDYRAAAVLLKGRGLLAAPARTLKPLARLPVTLPIPAAKQTEFEIRLRELILSFRQTAVDAGAGQMETPGAAESANAPDANEPAVAGG